MKITVFQDDITKIEVDVIVNAANSSLLGGGGVDGAIHRAGGSDILNECQAIRNKQGGCKTGEAVITTAGNLPAKKVIHTVGPVFNSDKDLKTQEEALANCYRNSLKLAEAHGLQSIAFPNISTGIYKFPKVLAAEIAIQTVSNYNSTIINNVIFVCFDQENYSIYKNKIKDKVIETISEDIHNMWMRWAKNLLAIEPHISEERIKRWTNDCFKPYAELSEEMKQLDRDFAKKILKRINNE